MENTKKRLAALRRYLKTLSADKTTFIVEGGAEFYVDTDPFTYLAKHGAQTPDGRRIILYPHPVDGVDELSMSLYQMIDEKIKESCHA